MGHRLAAPRGLLAVIGLLLSGVVVPTASAREAAACSALGAVPDAVQVAWVSPVRDRVRAGSTIEVVRVADLRKIAQAKDTTPIRLLQALGVVNAKGRGRAAKRDYKVTIFDVRSAWLCRPMDATTADKVVNGVAICPGGQSGGSSRSYTGCGYTRDTVTDGRGLDVFKVKWKDASSGGFCVMPLDRFMRGA